VEAEAAVLVVAALEEAIVGVDSGTGED